MTVKYEVPKVHYYLLLREYRTTLQMNILSSNDVLYMLQVRTRGPRAVVVPRRRASRAAHPCHVYNCSLGSAPQGRAALVEPAPPCHLLGRASQRGKAQARRRAAGIATSSKQTKQNKRFGQRRSCRRNSWCPGRGGSLVWLWLQSQLFMRSYRFGNCSWLERVRRSVHTCVGQLNS